MFFTLLSVYIHTRYLLLLFFTFLVLFFYQSLIKWGFSALCKNEKREKSDKKRKRIFLLFWDKKVAAVVYV